MSSVLYDEAHALCMHIELVLGKVEAIHLLIKENSALTNALNSKDGKKFIDYVASWYKAKDASKPSMSKGNAKFAQDFGDKILQVGKSIDYVKSWCAATRAILFKMTEQSVEYDIRWNNLFTTMFCNLFVTYSKVVIFIYMFPMLKVITLAMQIIPKFDKNSLSSPIKEIIDFVARCISDPFQLLLSNKASDQRQAVSRRLGQLISQIGPIMVQALGQWPLVDWENFNVFATRKTHETTFLDLDHVVLANITLLKETVFFFVLTFPDFAEKNKQFKAIMIAVCSETPRVYLTRQFFIEFRKLLNYYDKESKTIPKVLRNLINNSLKIKQNLTHSKRMAILSRLIKDMTAIASYNPNYLATFIYDLISLCSFAEYEVDCALSNEILPKETSELIGTLVATAKLFSKYGALLKRTFLYNMTIVDVTYLNQLLKNFNVEGVEWQVHFMDLCKTISQSLSSIDLEEIDKGCLYDMNPLLFTIGRTCTYFNLLKTQNKASHLQTVLEHLNTIVLHISFATNPTVAFLNYCQIHTLWRHIAPLSKIVQDPELQADYIAGSILLFPFFNIDSLAIFQSSGQVEFIKKQLEAIRGSILQRLNTHLTLYIGKGSRIQEISKQNRFEHLFNPIQIISLEPSSAHFDYVKERVFKDQVWQMRTLMMNLPGVFQFAGQEINFSRYIGQYIINCLTTVLFNEPIPDPLLVDSSFAAAAQFLWPLFTLIGAPFPRKLLECKYEHSVSETCITLLEQVSIIKTNYVSNAVAQQGGRLKLINLFEEFTMQFITKDYQKFKYYPHAKSFEMDKKVYGPDEAPLFSYNSLKYLIKNMGPHAGFAIDRILINHAAHLMNQIFKIQQNLFQELQQWYTDYMKGGSLWKKAITHPDIARASEMMINLGVTLKIRDILREAIRDVIDIYITGLPDLIIAGHRRVTGELPEKEHLIIEILTTMPHFHFIIGALRRESILQSTDSRLIFFFFSLLLSIPKYNDLAYDSESEYITYNLHLFPVGLDGFIQCISIFATNSDIREINGGMSLFFDIMSNVLQIMRQSNTALTTQYAFTILVDLFPRSISCIEYGRIGKNFPPSVISEAYRSAASQNFHEQVQRLAKEGKKKSKKNKKQKKSKK